MSNGAQAVSSNVADVQAAFSRQAPVFDALDEAPLIQWVRTRVRDEALRWIKPGERMLEINCGTGIDSLWFAERGMHVIATDDAPGMLAELQRKAKARPELPLDVQRCSFLQLDQLAIDPADMVFSNFGGINCTERLSDVLNGIDHRLKAGGIAVLVIMPRWSPWELIELFRGNFKHAFRRFNRNGTDAWIEGVRFRCWYHSVGDVRRALPTYELLSCTALSFFVPPPHLGPFAKRHPRMMRLLERLEALTCRWPWIRKQGDHTLVVLRKPAAHGTA